MIVDGERFSDMSRTDSAGDIHPVINDVVIKTPAGIHQRSILTGRGNIDHTGKQVHSPHAVTVRCGAVSKRHLILVVAVVEDIVGRNILGA